MSLKRPSRYDTEDDLMQMQQDVLAGNVKPSAGVTWSDRSANVVVSKKLKSKEGVTPVVETTGLSLVTDDTPTEQVLFNITERDVNSLCCVEPVSVAERFLPVFKYDNEDEVQVRSGNRQKRSLFFRQMERMKGKEIDSSLQERITSGSVQGSVILDGSGLKDNEDIVKIHEENLKKIQEMQPQEIEQHRKEIISHLDSKTLKFLQSLRQKKKKNRTLQETTGSSTSTATVPEGFTETVSVKEDELPINLGDIKKYVHMDKVELDKMAWMTMLPKPKSVDKNTGFPARFDFEGRLLLPTMQVGDDMGLHHHGKDQELPGYTLEELYHLSQSAFPSQQVIALRTLAKILANNWQGLFDDCLEENLLSQLLESGFAILLRVMLDKSEESTVAAAVYALHNLIVNEVDLVCLEKVFFWPFGHHCPFFKPSDAPEGNVVDSETEVRDLTDEEVVKMDVIKGLLRMDLLPRLRYILDIIKPEASVVGHILGILVCISHHSVEGADQVMNCPHLIDTIFAQFLPLHWGSTKSIKGKLVTIYSVPLHSSLRLVRTLVLAGRHIAVHLFSTYKMVEILSCYLTIDPSDKKLPIPDALKLSLESLRTWKSFLSYGLGTDIYENLYPLLMKQLHFCQSLSLSSITQAFDFEYAAALLSCFESLTGIARANSMKIPTMEEENCLRWKHISDLEIHARTMFCKWMQELSSDDFTQSGLTLIASCTWLLASLYEARFHRPGCDTVQVSQEINFLIKTSVLPFIESASFRNLSCLLSAHSCALYIGRSGCERDTKMHSSLGSVMWNGDITPIVKDRSPFPFFLALARLLHTFASCQHELENEVIVKFLSQPPVLQYIRDFVDVERSSLSSHWFTRFEIFTLCFIVFLASKKVKDLHISDSAVLFHCTSVLLPSWILPGDSYMIHKLLSDAIFKPDFYNEDYLSASMQLIETQDPFPLLTVSDDEVPAAENKIISNTCQNVLAIQSVYMPFCECIEPLESSWQRMEGMCHELESLSAYHSLKKAFNEYWMFLPILALYEEVKEKKPDAVSCPATIDIVVKSLQWLHFLIVYRKQSLNILSKGSLFVNTATVYLARNDLFLDIQIHQLLYSILKQLLKYHTQRYFDFTKVTWLQKRSFLDFYKELLEQYEAVSYGDQLFSCFVLLPLQQTFGVIYKKLLFEEHESSIRLLSVPIQKIPIQKKNFLYPYESDEKLLSYYFKLLLSDKINCCPLLNLMATHHLNHFLFYPPLTKLKQSMLVLIWKQREREAFSKLLYYKYSVKTIERGLEESDTLPENVAMTLNELGIDVS